MKFLTLVLLLGLFASCSSKKAENNGQSEVAPAVQTENSESKSAPEFGGYCTWNLCTKRKKIKGDEKYKLVHEGKIYYFENEKCMKRFQKDIKGNMMKAHSRWQQLERMSLKGAKD